MDECPQARNPITCLLSCEAVTSLSDDPKLHPDRRVRRPGGNQRVHRRVWELRQRSPDGRSQLELGEWLGGFRQQLGIERRLWIKRGLRIERYLGLQQQLRNHGCGQRP
jgi:hypothetical protein